MDLSKMSREELIRQLKLFRSKNMFQVLTETIAAAVFIFQDSKMKYVNPAAIKLTGYSEQELLAQDFWEIIHPDFQEMIKERGLARLKGGKVPTCYEVKIITKSGEERWLDFCGDMFKFEGKPAVLGTAFDITEHKQVKLELERFHAIMDQAGDAIFVTDVKTGHIIDVNETACRMLGYSHEELLQLTPGDIDENYPFKRPEDRIQFVKGMAKSGKAVFSDYGIMRRKDGSTFPMEVSVSAKEFQRKTYLLGIVRDITERKQINEQLQQAEERYRVLYENVPSMYFTVDEKGMVVSVNDFGASQLGYTVKELLDQSVLKVFLEEDRPKVLEQLKTCIEWPSQVHSWQIRKIRKDKSLLWVEEFARMVEGPNGKPNILIVCQDITDRRLTEDALKETKENLELRVKERTAELINANIFMQQEIVERRRAEEALQESRERLQTVMEKIPHGIGVVEPGGEILYFNPALYELLGYSASELENMNIASLFHPDDRERMVRKVKYLVAGGVEYPSEYNIIHKAGNTIPVEISSRPIQFEGKLAILGIVVDITERKKAEEALRISEERYRTLIEQAGDGIFQSDEKGNLLAVNTAGYKMLGYSAEDLKGQNVKTLFVPEDLQRHPLRFKELGGETVIRSERRFKRKDGSVFPVEIASKMLPNGHILAIIRDFTQRKQAEEELRKERDLAQKYLSIAGVIFILVNADQKISLINKRGCEILGCNEADIIGKNWFDCFIPKGDRQRIRKVFNQLMQGEASLTEYYENDIITTSGESRTIAWHNTIVKDENGCVIGTLSSGDDITERKKTEMALRESEERYTLAVEAGKVGIWDWNIRTNEIYVAPNLKHLIGYNDSEIKNNISSWLKTIHADDRKKVKEAYESLVHGRIQYYESEHRKIHKDGSIRWFIARANAIRDASDNVVRITGSDSDITARKLMEEELKKHRDHLEELVEERTARLKTTNETLRKEIKERKRTEERLRQSREQLRKLSAHIESTREEERKRIARQIHDELGQSLSTLQMDLAWLELNLTNGKKAVLDKIRSMSTFSGDMIKLVQRISQELRSSVLDHLGFTSALSWQTQEFEKKTGIRCDFICKNKDIKLKEDQSNALFRIVQEALTNIFRHAHATHASVILEEKNRMIRLTISDDGIGIAKERMNSLDSLGLVGIRERLHFLKGKLDIKGIKGEGTTLIITVPLENKGNK